MPEKGSFPLQLTGKCTGTAEMLSSGFGGEQGRLDTMSYNPFNYPIPGYFHSSGSVSLNKRSGTFAMRNISLQSTRNL